MAMVLHSLRFCHHTFFMVQIINLLQKTRWQSCIETVFRGYSLSKKEPPTSLDVRGSRRTAATYSPNWWVSTIIAGELNFSVRNGKRWFLTAIATAICYLREYFKETLDRFFAFSICVIFLYKRKSFGQLVQVC